MNCWIVYTLQMKRSKSSLLLVHKPTGVTSFASLAPIKRVFGKKVGHGGTLDKFAEGLMIVLTGTFTKLNALVSNLDKKYIATICFGSETSTLDPEGEIVKEGPIPTLAQIEQVIANEFQGPIQQTPPHYSAIHIDGKRAHALARSGQDFEVPSRQVTIYKTEILDWKAPFLTLAVHCSKGTYIRSLARDIALSCNSRGHVSALKRTAIGPFLLDSAIDVESQDALIAHSATSVERLRQLNHMGSLVVSPSAAMRLRYGNLPLKDAIIESKVTDKDSYALVFDLQHTLLAIVGLNTEGVPNKVYSLPCMEM